MKRHEQQCNRLGWTDKLEWTRLEGAIGRHCKDLRCIAEGRLKLQGPYNFCIVGIEAKLDGVCARTARELKMPRGAQSGAERDMLRWMHAATFSVTVSPGQSATFRYKVNDTQIAE